MTSITSIALPCYVTDISIDSMIACAEKCIEYDWRRGTRGIVPSSAQKERMHTPVKVEFWDVKEDIKGFLEKAGRVKRRFQKLDNLTATTGRRNLHHVAGSVVASTCNFMSKKRSGSSVTYETEASPSICLAEEGKAENGNSGNSDKSRSKD